MIRVTVDPRAVLGYLTDSFESQFPYAVCLALNSVANKAQNTQRASIRKNFRLRRSDYVLKGIKISKADRATKTSWRVVIQVAYPDDRHFMNDHEQGGNRVRHGGSRLWVPNKAVFQSKIIGRGNPLHPRNLKLHRDQAGRMVGEQRTFLVRSKGRVLVLQREDRTLTKASHRAIKHMTLDNVATGFGPHRKRQRAIHRTGGVRLLYRLVERVRIPARLEFVETVTKTVHSLWSSEMRTAMLKAMRPK